MKFGDVRGCLGLGLYVELVLGLSSGYGQWVEPRIWVRVMVRVRVRVG